MLGSPLSLDGLFQGKNPSIIVLWDPPFRKAPIWLEKLVTKRVESRKKKHIPKSIENLAEEQRKTHHSIGIFGGNVTAK